MCELSSDQLDSMKELVMYGPILYEQIPMERGGCNGFHRAPTDELITLGLAAKIVVKGKPTFVAATQSAMELMPT